MSAPVVAVNGRFLTMTLTGVQRYAHEILPRLAASLDARLRVIVPPRRVLDADDPALGAIATTSTWHGVHGHYWEQVVLPRLVRELGARALWSPCSWGPIAVRRHVPVVHDIAPFVHGGHVTPMYWVLARLLTPPLVRRAAFVATPSSGVRTDLVEQFRLDPDRVRTIPPGVGAPFDSWPLDDLERRPRRYCVMVGAHDTRKNPGFLLDLWPDVRKRTGLELHLTYRSFVTTRRQPDLGSSKPDGVVLHADPTDEKLADLYANALCLLWPSHYEGYGFPLLEATAVGTPFLATDVGAARELAVNPELQILPLERQIWVERVEALARDGVGRLARQSAERARTQTWEAAAAQTARLLDDLARSD